MSKFIFALNLKRVTSWFMVILFLSPCAAWSLNVASGNFETILNAQSKTLVVWKFFDNPKLFIFDFPSLTHQGNTFNRITQFIEQVQQRNGYPVVMSNTAFAQYLVSLRRTQADFAFGHDVLVSELVQFYNFADRDKIELFPEEIVLRDFLLQQGFIKLWRGFYQTLQPDIVVLSIPQEQPQRENEPVVTELARRTILLHEISHGEYYTNPYYANYCRHFWKTSLNDGQRHSFIQFFKKYNYDVTSGDLLVNEMQAYLMFTPDSHSFNAKKLGVSEDNLQSMRMMFRQGKPPTQLPLQ